MLLRCGGMDICRKNRPFRFMASWASHPDFTEVVRKGWEKTGGNMLSRLSDVQKEATTFNKEVFGNIFRRKRHCENRLRGVQKALDERETSSMLQLERELQDEYGRILYQEELLWFQKSR
ncbi:hypothetical protein OROGR_018956 [Orobanche gracilis]